MERTPKMLVTVHGVEAPSGVQPKILSGMSWELGNAQSWDGWAALCWHQSCVTPAGWGEHQELIPWVVNEEMQWFIANQWHLG